MSSENEKEKPGFVTKVATFIVDKRKGFFLFFYSGGDILPVRYAVDAGQQRYNVLPARFHGNGKGLSMMNEQFVTYGSANVMIDNVTYETAERLTGQMLKINGISEAVIDQTEAHYHNGAAMISVTFKGEAGDEIAKTAI